MPDFLSDKRDRLLTGLLKVFSVAGLVAYVPAVSASIHDNLWSVAIIDTAMYASVVALALANRIRAEAKLFVIIASSLVVGATAILAARQNSIGYVWMMVGVVMASLFARPRHVVATIAAAVLASAGSAFYLVVEGGAAGLSAETASVAVSSLLVVSAFIAVVVRQLLGGLDAALRESSSLSDRLAQELRESNKVRAMLQTKLATEESLLRELQHRVRNNFQSVLGLLGRERGDGNGDISSARRRIRALAASEDLFLESAGARADAYSVAKAAIMAASDGGAKFELEGSASGYRVIIGYHAAGTAAILLSDALSGLASAGFGAALSAREDGAGASIGLRPIAPDGGADAAAAEPALRAILASPLAQAAAPEVTVSWSGDGAGIAGISIAIRVY